MVIVETMILVVDRISNSFRDGQETYYQAFLVDSGNNIQKSHNSPKYLGFKL
jgi:hypothetical protein